MAELSKNSESQTIPWRDPDPLHEVFSINLEFKKKVQRVLPLLSNLGLYIRNSCPKVSKELLSPLKTIFLGGRALSVEVMFFAKDYEWLMASWATVRT